MDKLIDADIGLSGCLQKFPAIFRVFPDVPWIEHTGEEPSLFGYSFNTSRD